MLPVNSIIYTGSHWLCQKIFIESTGDKEVDAALKSTFHDHFHRTKPLRMAREDVQTALAWRNKKLKIETGVSVAEQKQGQKGLFE